MSSRMLMIMSRRQPRSQMSRALMLLEGGAEDLVMETMLRRMMMISSWRQRRSNTWGTRKESQEMMARRVEGRKYESR